MFCPKCGKEFNGKFCTECGTNNTLNNSLSSPTIQSSPVQPQTRPLPLQQDQKYCKFCGSIINLNAVVCVSCGRQVEQLAGQSQYQAPIYINNAPQMGYMRQQCIKNKWIAFVLCFFFGVLGVHKFYEGKILFGVVYIFTWGLFGIGWLVDCIILLCKPNPYSV